MKTSAAAISAATLAAGTTKAETTNPKFRDVKIPHNGDQRPNVLFIISDQHNAKIMSHLNDANAYTPNIDRLASIGTRFDRCTTNNPICTPSRVSYISGQYCHNHGYYGLSGPHPMGLPTIFGHFKRAGYTTAAVGKIHCPAYWVEKDTDCFHDTCGTSIEGRSKEYGAYLEERGLTKLEDHGEMQEFGKKGRQTCDARASKVSYRDGQEGWAVHKAIEFMKDAAAKNKPFFTHVSLPKPHQCYTPAQEFWDYFNPDKLKLPPNTNYDMRAAKKAPHLVHMADNWRTGHWTLFEPKTFEAGRLRKLRGYLGNVMHVDHSVGELMGFLQSSGLDKNTIVVYCADHGDYAAEHDIMEKAPGICSDAITRVPFIWSWPGHIKKNHTVKDVVETVDLAPTLCALAGIEELQTADGKDISSYLKGEDNLDSERLGLTEFAWSKSIRKGPWRFVFYPTAMFKKEYPNGFGELYNVDQDPWEMNNLYFDKKYADLVNQMNKECLEMLITTSRPAIIHGSVVKEPADGPQVAKHYYHKVNWDNKIHHDRVAAAAHSAYRNYN